jgi:hypothetical protein
LTLQAPVFSFATRSIHAGWSHEVLFRGDFLDSRIDRGGKCSGRAAAAAGGPIEGPADL